MSKQIPVHIYFVLDRSGSMGGVADDVINGFNSFITEQKATPGKCRLTLVQFDSNNPHEVILDAVKIADVPDLTRSTFQPRGMTPLLDAEGRVINMAIARETARALANKTAEAILFVTYTDGMENTSTEWTRTALSDAKTHAETKGWSFLYLGCGHDAYGQSATIGTRAANTQVFANDSKGVQASYTSISNLTRGIREFANDGTAFDNSALYASVGVDKTAEAEMASRT